MKIVADNGTASLRLAPHPKDAMPKKELELCTCHQDNATLKSGEAQVGSRVAESNGQVNWSILSASPDGEETRLRND